jgi:ATP-dependent RNA helicase DeaD
MTFEEAGLNPELLKAINDLGFVSPTPIQEKVIPYLLTSDTDLVALAQTGTGKTAAFGLPILEQVDTSSKTTQAMVLCPTRELAMQITKDMVSYSKYIKKVNIVAVYGGAAIQGQIKDLDRGAQIVVGTPGRMLDLMKRKKLRISNIKTLVLDEADEMLSMGFKEELDTILSETPEQRQTLLFSATMPREIVGIAKKYMKNAEEISAGTKNIGAENVNHYFYMVSARDRYSALKRIADINPKIYGIVFCRTRAETKDVADKLMSDGYNADALHGDLSQAQRDFVMNRFRQKHLQILVATDVAARGLDVSDLTHIINYNLPDENEIYIHRSGRTGRAGKKGTSLTIIHSRELHKIKSIEKKLGKKVERKMVPGGKEICEKQLFNLIDKMENTVVDDSEIDQFLPVIYKKLSWLSREELIKQFVSVEFNRFLEYYRNAPDLNIKARESSSERRGEGRRERGERGERRERSEGGRERSRRMDSANFSRFFINIGANQKINPLKLIGLINDTTNLRNMEIGKIEIMKNFTFFEVDKEFEKKVLQSFDKAEFDGQPIVVELSKPKPDIVKDQERRKKSGGGNRRKKW